MPINPSIPLMAAQPVSGVRDAVNAGFNQYHKAKDNTRQNKLLALKTQAQAADQTRQNALLQIQQAQNARAQEQHDLTRQATTGAMLHKAFTGLSKLDPELRAAQIALMKPSLAQHGFDDDDLNMLVDDTNLNAATRYFSQYAPVAKAEIGRYKTQELPDGSIVVLDSATSTTEELAPGQTIDLSILPESMQADVKNLPRDSQEKIVTEYAKPKTQAAIKESKEKAEKAQKAQATVLKLVSELLNNEDGVKSNFGALDEWIPNILPSTRDADAAMSDLKAFLTVDNLALLSGVLSDSDMKVLERVGGEGLSGSQDRVLTTLKNLKKSLSGGQSLTTEDQEALKWAKQNRNDPRAKQIISTIGG